MISQRDLSYSSLGFGRVEEKHTCNSSIIFSIFNLIYIECLSTTGKAGLTMKQLPKSEAIKRFPKARTLQMRLSSFVGKLLSCLPWQEEQVASTLAFSQQ